MILLCAYLCKNKLLDYFKFIFYGIVQGLTEFIPISSTAHLKILSLLFGINDPGSSLSAIIQIGSVFAVIFYFRKNLIELSNKNKSRNIFNSFWSNKLNLSILIGTIPIICLGVIVKVFIPEFTDSILRSNTSIALASILMAFIMLFADSSNSKFINLKNHTFVDSLLIGLAQSFAIIPGVSRSGVTISMALFSGWERKDSAKFSFLLSIPAITLSAVVEFINSINQFSAFSLLPLLVGLFTTFFTSLFAINFLISYISSNGLKIFIYYRFIFGILILLNLSLL